MSIVKGEKIWYNDKFIPWDDALIHVAAHAVSYASCIFEGIRCYSTPQGPAIFRLKEHVGRLVDSAKIYRMPLNYSSEEIQKALVKLVQINGMEHCYLRPIVIRGFGDVGVNPLGNPIDVYLLCWEWGKYLGDEALQKGVDVCVSSWNRMAPNTLPAMAKAAANYMNSQLIKMEAELNGFAEGIALDPSGFVSEGSGENIFAAKDGKLYTPPLASSVLPGITRNSIITLAGEMRIPLVEQALAREFLYLADEVFFTGTAAEVTPIRSVDRIKVGNGRPGPITKRLQERFLSIVHGETDDPYGWLTFPSEGESTRQRRAAS